MGVSGYRSEAAASRKPQAANRKMTKNLKTFFLLGIILLWAGGTVFGGEAFYPRETGFVNDFAGIISPGTEAKISAWCRDIERQTTAEVAVATVKSIAPETVETYANKLFEKWGIGKKGKDNGVLLLVALKERKTRIEVGYGLEGAIPDAKASAIYRKIMVPNFRSGDFDQGILKATEAIAALIAQEYQVQINGVDPGTLSAIKPRSALSRIIGGLFTLLIFIFIFGSRMGLFGWMMLGAGGRRGGYWSGGGGGGFSGGFGGFGGGMSGGGGAGGGW